MRILFILILLCATVILASCGLSLSGEKALRNALQTGDTNYIKTFLDSGGDVNKSVQYTHSRREYAPLLDVAIEYGQLTSVAFLLKNGADPNKRDSYGDTPLHWAIARVGNEVPRRVELAIFNTLLSGGAALNLNTSTHQGNTPLHDAAFFGQSEMVRILLDAKVDVNGTNWNGECPLHLAGNAEVARVLLAAGADPSRRTLSGEVPSERASGLMRSNVAELLLNAETRQ